MDRKYTILIADNNIHVRNFLARELGDPRHDILQAANHMQLFARIFGKQTPDLIIFDLDIPYINCIDVLKQIQDITPPIPVIVYSYLLEYRDHPLVQRTRGFVEKGGDIIALQNLVAEILHPHETLKHPEQEHHDPPV
jgi:DNA-binding NtrC family response regulator